MRSRRELWVWGVAAAAATVGFVIAVVAVVVLATGEPRSAILDGVARVIPIGLLLAAGVAWFSVRWFRAYYRHAERLADQVELVATVNPSHDIAVDGPEPIRRMGSASRHLATRLWESMSERDAAVHEGRSLAAAERDRLTALVGAMSRGVVVCNVDGRVVLYNSAARDTLGGDERTRLGLGRSIFSAIDREVVLNAFHHLELRLARDDRRPVRFVTSSPTGRVLRLTMSAITAPGERRLDGVVLSIEDGTGNGSSDPTTERRAFMERARGSVASLRAAVETLLEFKEMPEDERQAFRSIVLQETHRLSETLEEAQQGDSGGDGSSWGAGPMLAMDVVRALMRQFTAAGWHVGHVDVDEEAWMEVDVVALVAAVRRLAGAVAAEHGPATVSLEVSPDEHHMALRMRWPGTEAVGLVNDALRSDSEPLRRLATSHGGEVWCHGRDGETTLAVLLRGAEPVRSVAAPTAGHDRPVFYDFAVVGGDAGADRDSPIARLAFTVFDTETTGLDPAGGDEIISIGAVRILNGRVLRHETFDQLVDPRRPVSQESEAIHGISDDVLVGQPRVEEVLQRFDAFREDTILVGHNVAFDLKFMALKAPTAGVAFDGPVLDTLLMAELLYSDEQAHSLDALARLLGVEVTGRHTSLGDALVTADVFLALAEILRDRGIGTLGELLDASASTRYARLEY